MNRSQGRWVRSKNATSVRCSSLSEISFFKSRFIESRPLKQLSRDLHQSVKVIFLGEKNLSCFLQSEKKQSLTLSFVATSLRWNLITAAQNNILIDEAKRTRRWAKSKPYRVVIYSCVTNYVPTDL